MSVFSQRHRGYKAGVVLLLLSLVIGAWGVVAPGWLREDDGKAEGAVYCDLWFVNCHGDFSRCQPAQFSTDDVSLLATMGLCCVGLLMLLSCCALLVRANFCLSVPTYGITPQVLAMLAGLSLFIACMTYVGDNADFVHDFPGFSFGPSFILTLCASLLSGLGGVLLALCNKRPGASYYRNSRFRRPTLGGATLVDAASPSVSSVSSIQVYPQSAQLSKVHEYPPTSREYLTQGRGLALRDEFLSTSIGPREHVPYTSYQLPHDFR